MIGRRFFAVTVVIIHIAAVSSVTDHLVPPLPPAPQNQQLNPPVAQQPAARGGPPRAYGYPPTRYANTANSEPPGFMQRIARWFGFNDGNATEDQLQAQTLQQYPQYKQSPRGYQQAGYKAPCGLCNKYPWVPMFPGNIQYPLSKHYQAPQINQIQQAQWNQQQEQLRQQQLHYQHQQHQQQQQQQYHQQALSPPPLTHQQKEQLAGYNYPQHQQQLPAYPPLKVAESQYAPTQFQPPLVQRAVQFSPPPPQDFRPPPPPPKQTGNPPPPYNPQPFFTPIQVPQLSPSALPPVYEAEPFRPVPQQHQNLSPTQFQQLPKFQPTVQFQDQPLAPNYEEQQPPRYEDPIQFQEFHETEPPRSIIEHVGASSENKPVYPTQIPPNNQEDQRQSQRTETSPSFEIVKSHQVNDFVSEIQYPANFVQSHYIDVSQQHHSTTLTPDDQSPVTLTELGSYSQQYTAPTEEPVTDAPDESIIYHNHQEFDHYATDNYPSASSHNLSVQHDNHLDIDPIQHSSSENYFPPNEVFQPTPEPTTLQPQFATDPFQHTTVEIVPSLQTSFTQGLNQKRDRETPKRLLDSPIHYYNGRSSPRPFTRDPGELHFRSSTATPPYQIQEPLSTATPWRMALTPTSTYTSIDASGHNSGMTPPAQQQPPKQYHQIIIPYTTKHQPRPFQPKEHAGRYDNWATSNEFDPHEQQESKLVTATQAPSQRTTKYLTKILASNLRELLRKEHQQKNTSKNGFDLSKLQKNIDDWTEQEFTSLSHRASTVSLRGHSKHIPTEYLTTTPSMREAKTTGFAPNHFEPLVYKDRGTKRYEFQHLNENRIEAQAPATSTTPVSTTTTTTTTTPEPSTTTAPPTVTPFYTRATATIQIPKENWNQAKVTVSPLTKEKIYVVTPQPTPSAGPTGSFKSPRFIVRPTPASAGSNITPKSSPYTPELFGLMGISAYIPAAPVETFDGHSKVITVVTPSNSIKRRSGDSELEEASQPEETVPESSNSDRGTS